MKPIVNPKGSLKDRCGNMANLSIVEQNAQVRFFSFHKEIRNIMNELKKDAKSVQTNLLNCMTKSFNMKCKKLEYCGKKNGMLKATAEVEYAMLFMLSNAQQKNLFESKKKREREPRVVRHYQCCNCRSPDRRFVTIISIQLYVEVPVAIDMLGRWCLALSLISHGSTIFRNGNVYIA